MQELLQTQCETSAPISMPSPGRWRLRYYNRLAFDMSTSMQILSVLETRNICPFCRYRKCIAVGLNPQLIHSDRGVDAAKLTSANPHQARKKLSLLSDARMPKPSPSPADNDDAEDSDVQVIDCPMNGSTSSAAEDPEKKVSFARLWARKREKCGQTSQNLSKISQSRP